MKQRSEVAVLNQLAHWSENQHPVRLVLLTSSRAEPSLRTDIFSDYDVELVVLDVKPYAERNEWIHDFGEVLVYFDDQWSNLGLQGYTCLVLYEDGTKIDFQVYPTQLFQQFKQMPGLPGSLDVGYRILMDKDNLAEGLAVPTHTFHIPHKPTEQEFSVLVREFWWETTYVAKNLWRDELLYARYNLDAVIKFNLLRRMLEWSIEIDKDWVLQTGVMGKGFKKLLAPEIWNTLTETFVGPRLDENWQALFQTTELFRKVAQRVAVHLGYEYPAEMDEKVNRYLHDVQHVRQDADPRVDKEFASVADPPT